jgi:hypothetical protein
VNVVKSNNAVAAVTVNEKLLLLDNPEGPVAVTVHVVVDTAVPVGIVITPVFVFM